MRTCPARPVVTCDAPRRVASASHPVPAACESFHRCQRDDVRIRPSPAACAVPALQAAQTWPAAPRRSRPPAPRPSCGGVPQNSASVTRAALRASFRCSAAARRRCTCVTARPTVAATQRGQPRRARGTGQTPVPAGEPARGQARARSTSVRAARSRSGPGRYEQ